MQEYRKNLGKVSLTAEGGWTKDKSFDILSIVYDEHTLHGFISKQYVPEGVDLYNKEYWMPFNVSGYSDNNIIILSEKTSETSIKAYTLEEAINSVAVVGRRPGMILGFYNENTDRLDIGGRWEIWQFNSTTISEWEDVAHWQNIYYSFNKFVGWYRDVESLKKYNPFPEIGCYAYVGTEFNEATIYRCDTKFIWTDTTQHAWDYIKVILQGNVTVGENGNWFNDGKDTGIPASIKGENGKTPVFRQYDNTIQYSFDNVNWITISDKVAAWFRWNATTGDTQANNVGRIQISRDNVTWTNLSGDIINNLHISKYIGADESLPTSGIAEGTIYAKGPYYSEDDTLNDNPIYRLWVYAWKDNTLAWQDNGEFQSIAAGVVQETGGSETEVMSQKVTTEKLTELASNFQEVELTDGYLDLYGNANNNVGNYVKTSYIAISTNVDLIVYEVEQALDYNCIAIGFYDIGKKFISYVDITNYKTIENYIIKVIIPSEIIPSETAFIRCTVRKTGKAYFKLPENQYNVLREINELKDKIDNTISNFNLLVQGTTFSAGTLNNYIVIPISVKSGDNVTYIVKDSVFTSIDGGSGAVAYNIYGLQGSNEILIKAVYGNSYNSITIEDYYDKLIIKYSDNGQVASASCNVDILIGKLSELHNYSIENSEKITNIENLLNGVAGTVSKNKPYFAIQNYVKEGDFIKYTVKDSVFTSTEGFSGAVSYNIYGLINGQAELLKAVYGNSVNYIEIKKDYTSIHVNYTDNGYVDSASCTIEIKKGDAIKTEYEVSKIKTPEISIWTPSKIYALEGTKLQIFKSNLAVVYNSENYELDLISNGGTGRGNNRDIYYEYDVDNTNNNFTLQFGLKNEEREVHADETTIIHVTKKESPSTNKNVLVIGDSFTDQQYWVSELRRLLTGNITDNYSDIESSSIASDNLNNITFIGTRDTDKTPNEGYSGMHYGFFATNNFVAGSLTNPFWNTSTNSVDFDNYCNENGFDKIDCCIILLGTNGNNNKEYIDTLWGALLKHNPNIKVLIGGRCFAVPYGPGIAAGVYWNQTWFNLTLGVHSLNKTLQEYCNSDEYSANFLYVDYNIQLDGKHNMPHKTLPANQRNAEETIVLATDNVHPNKYGYWQIADAFRAAFHYWCLE